MHDATAERLTAYLRRIAANRNDLWQAVDRVREANGKGGLPRWPSNVFAPSAAYSVLLRRLYDPQATIIEAAALAMLAPWRATQGIYRFDPTILDALWDTPVSGPLPAEILQSLPEWCCYIECPGKRWRDRDIHGFFVSLDFEATHNVPWLRLAPDYGTIIDVAIPLPLVGTLEECVDTWVRDAARHQSEPVDIDAPNRIRQLADELAPMISIVLYLCSINADIPDRAKIRRPRTVRTKRGERMFPPDTGPRIWECGFRVGAAIRTAQEQERSKDRGGTHAGPRPHIRRAHWHSFWTGEKATLAKPRTERKLVVKWLPPIPVNIDEEALPVPTIHPVVGQKRG